MEKLGNYWKIWVERAVLSKFWVKVKEGFLARQIQVQLETQNRERGILCLTKWRYTQHTAVAATAMTWRATYLGGAGNWLRCIRARTIRLAREGVEGVTSERDDRHIWTGWSIIPESVPHRHSVRFPRSRPRPFPMSARLSVLCIASASHFSALSNPSGTETSRHIHSRHCPALPPWHPAKFPVIGNLRNFIPKTSPGDIWTCRSCVHFCLRVDLRASYVQTWSLFRMTLRDVW